MMIKQVLLLSGLVMLSAASAQNKNFTGIKSSGTGVEPTLRCFQNGRQVLQETGKFVSSKTSGSNVYKFGNKSGGVSIIMFDLGETVCTLTKLSNK